MRALNVIAAGAVALTCAAGLPASASGAPPTRRPASVPAATSVAALTSTLAMNGRLTAGRSIGIAQYTLTMQSDGNLVLRGNGRVLWTAATAPRAAGGYATVRSDGAFVVRNKYNQAVWGTRAAGAGAYLVVQTNGDVVLRTATRSYWSLGRPGAEALTAGASLRSGQFIQSRVNGARLTMQSDGKLVQAGSHGGTVWTQSCPSGSALSVRTNGSMAVTTPTGGTCWSSPSVSGSGFKVAMNGVNNVVASTSAGARGVTPAAAYTAYLNAHKALALFDQLNADRAANGRPALRWNAKLASSAHAHNLTMASRNTLGHQLSGEATFSSRITAAGYPWSSCAENIGRHSLLSYAGVKDLHTMMMSEVAPDDGHRQNILSTDVVDVGIDVYVAGGNLWLTEDFGRPL